MGGSRRNKNRRLPWILFRPCHLSILSIRMSRLQMDGSRLGLFHQVVERCWYSVHQRLRLLLLITRVL
jgi:hypothetical protein